MVSGRYINVAQSNCEIVTNNIILANTYSNVATVYFNDSAYNVGVRFRRGVVSSVEPTIASNGDEYTLITSTTATKKLYTNSAWSSL